MDVEALQLRVRNVMLWGTAYFSNNKGNWDFSTCWWDTSCLWVDDLYTGGITLEGDKLSSFSSDLCLSF